MRDAVPKILLVSDDQEIAAAMREQLAGLGEVSRAPSAEAALGLLADGDWSLLIADVELPGMDGLQLLRQARERPSPPAGLIVSGAERFDYAVGAIRAGASDYVTKPVGREELRSKVRAAIASQRASGNRSAAPERVLAIGAHPDDVEIGCGGLLLRHREHGDSINVLTLTGGEAGGSASTRVRESQHAAELLGARLFLLDLDDTSISEASKTIRAIAGVIETVRPTTVYTHTSHDLHQDHRSAHHASLVAARDVPRIYSYQSPSSTVEFRPRRFASIDDVLELKLRVVAAYESQTSIRTYLDPDLLRATARYWSRYSGSEYAEPLEAARDADIFSERLGQESGSEGVGDSAASHAGR